MAGQAWRWGSASGQLGRPNGAEISQGAMRCVVSFWCCFNHLGRTPSCRPVPNNSPSSLLHHPLLLIRLCYCRRGSDHRHHEQSYVPPPGLPSLAPEPSSNRVSAVRFLDIIKPFVPYIPEVAAPERKVPFQQRMMWTGVRHQFEDCGVQ